MDPVACIAAYAAKKSYLRDSRDVMQEWYAKHGFHPTLSKVAHHADERGWILPGNWVTRARKLGAVQ